MKTQIIILLAFLGLLVSCQDAAPRMDQSAFNGRWNLTVSESAAWWLEVTGAETDQPGARFVGAPGGGMYEPDEISIADGELMFAFNGRRYRLPDETGPWSEIPERRGVYRARIVDGKLTGYLEVEGHPETRQDFTGERAPVITDKDDGTWKEEQPVALFNGKNLTGWRPMISGKELGWKVENGILVNVPPANNLVSEQKFWNFKLHAEYRLVEHSNSGIGLRGRYEIQIHDSYGQPPAMGGHGALYSRIPPTENASLPAGEWQTMDITLIGRDLTVVLNGKKIHDKVEVEGLTAMAHDFDEDQPGPFSVQGDHEQVEIRALTVTPLTKK